MREMISKERRLDMICRDIRSGVLLVTLILLLGGAGSCVSKKG